MTETDYARQKFEPDMKKYYAFWILYQYPQPLHQGRPVSIHAALHTILLLQLGGRHLFNKIPPLELLARECKDASATVYPSATHAIPTEPLLTC